MADRNATPYHAAIVREALAMALTGPEGGTVRQVERAITWAMAQRPAPHPLPPADLPNVYIKKGL